MAVFNDSLYLGTGNAVAKVWRTDDGVIWEQANIDGFGDNDNKRIHSLIVFDGYLYAGTGNRKGTEIWRCKVSGGDYNSCFLETVFKNEPQKLDVLRMMRDKILSSSMGGSDFVELYYRYSSEIIDICHAYPELKEKTLEVLKCLIPGMILLTEGRRKNLSISMTRELLSLSEKYAKVGSPGLKSAVRKIKTELKNGNLSTLLRPAEIEMLEKSIK